MMHKLKILPEYFEGVYSGLKTWEYRKNDRGFHEGDLLELREWNGEYTGRKITVKVTYLVEDFKELPSEYCVMSIVKV